MGRRGPKYDRDRGGEQFVTGILTNRVLFTLALMLIVAAAGTHWMNTGTASADYLPPLLPDYLPIGPAGGNVADLTGMINESDAATKWNQWTGTNKLSATGTSTSGCGTSKACIVYSNDNQILDRVARKRFIRGSYRIEDIDPQVAVAIAEGEEFVAIQVETIDPEEI